MGLHQRYAVILANNNTDADERPIPDEYKKKLRAKFKSMMKALYTEKGANFRIEILAEPPVQDFISTHADTLDSTFQTLPMSDTMRSRLQESNYIFSGMKTFHELNEAFPSLLDENGERKSFDQFLSDVQAIDEKYNSNYLRAEYNFVQNSAQMATKWELYEQDGDRYNLQYRTAGDNRVRPEHQALDGITLPITDPFWDSYYPPNGWNCRCTVAQVRKSKYPVTPRDEAMQRGQEALTKDKKGIFKFNPGKQKKAVPDYNPYTISRCNDCDIPKKGLKLAHYVPDNENCAACKFIRECEKKQEYVYKHGKGEVHISKLVKKEDSDYNKLIQIAEFFANQGSTVKLAPKMSRPPQFDYKCHYSSLIGTKFMRKCPDLNIDGEWFEHEGFTSQIPKNALRNMLNDGLKQANRLIIDQPNLTESYIKRSIRNRIQNGQDIKEVWLKKDNTITLIYKKSEG